MWGGDGLEKVNFFTNNPNLKYFFFLRGGGGGGGCGGGVCEGGNRVSDFFYKKSN